MTIEQKLDCLLIHPPVSPSGKQIILDADTNYTSQFVSFPTGFFNMASNLEKAGIKTRIFNLGEKMITTEEPMELLLEEVIVRHNPSFVGIDIHWMIHSYGAVETARQVKRINPDIKIIVGGLTASVYPEEILRNFGDVVDQVLIGQADNSIVALLKKGSLKESIGTSRHYAERGVRDYLDIARYDLLLEGPSINPERGIITLDRGCFRNCSFCAGGERSFRRIMQAPETYMITPKTAVRLVKQNQERGRKRIYLYGDIRRGGKDYVNLFFEGLRKEEVKDVEIIFEFFSPADEGYLRKWVDWAEISGSNLEATHSPDSGDPTIRRRYSNKNYSNRTLLEHCKLAARQGIPQSIYFLLGFPDDNEDSVKETISLADDIMRIYSERFTSDNLRHEVVSYNLMQFLDAGSYLVRDPKKYGIELNFSGFRGIVDKLRQAEHWTEVIGFRTRNFSEEDLIEQYYLIQFRLNKLYRKHGLRSAEEYGCKDANLKEDYNKWQVIKGTK
jgi:radical SAM superfamily enzyme YgiQ (UPF0313 family)